MTGREVLRRCRRRCTLASAILAFQSLGSSTWAEPGAGFTIPPESVIERLRHDYGKHDWLRVTTGSTRLELRVGRIDGDGLKDLVARRDAPPPPAVVPWSSIARVDRRVSQFRRGQITGFLVGGIAGALGGSWLGSAVKGTRTSTWMDQTYEIDENHMTAGAWLGTIVGAVGGAWMWGRIGDRNVTERPLYVAPAPASSSPAAVAGNIASENPPDTAPAPPNSTMPPSISEPSTIAQGAADTIAIVPPGKPSPPPSSRAEVSSRAASSAIERASSRIQSENLLRITGDFGRFQGFATHAGPEGLDGLRVDLTGGVAPAAPPGLVSWDRIYSIEKRGNSAGKGAVSVGLALGAAGAGLAFLLVTGFGGDGADAAGPMFEAGAITGGIGAVIGGLVGAAIPRWHVVYGQP
jgi:hypothetical protein